MARQFAGGKLVIASHNQGKVREIQALLAPFGAEVISAGALGLAEPVEDGATFVANAEIKALAAATASGQASIRRAGRGRTRTSPWPWPRCKSA